NAAVETGGVLVGKEVKIKVELELNQPNCVYSNTSIMNGKSIDENNQINNETINNDVHKLVTENLTDLVEIINRSGTIQYVNPSFKTVLNDDVSLLQKSNFFEKIHHDDQVYLKKELFSFSKKTIKKALKVEFRLQHKEGHSIDVEATIKSLNEPSFSKNELLLITMRDISERKEIEKSIYQLAFYDSLTNLPNRRSLMNQLRNEVMNQNQSRSKLSVLFIDLDNFKQINDQWGHDTGDLVLIEAVKRILSVIRPTDIAARLGGDEFVVMLKDMEHEDDAIEIVQRILN